MVFFHSSCPYNRSPAEERTYNAGTIIEVVIVIKSRLSFPLAAEYDVSDFIVLYFFKIFIELTCV